MKSSKKILIICLVVIFSLSTFLVYKSVTNKKIVLDDVVLKEKVKEGTFAFFLEQSDGTYLISQDTTFPTSGYKYNAELSGCMDDDKKLIPNSLSYANGKVIVNIAKTSYCYVYFDIFNSLAEIFDTNNSLVQEYKGIGYYSSAQDYDSTNPYFTRPIYYWYVPDISWAGHSAAENAVTVRDSWNVVFKDRCWQIIRTTENGGVKLLYNGTPEVGTDSLTGETTYDCSDNRDLYRIGETRYTYDYRGTLTFSDSYTASTSGATTTFTLVNSDGTTPSSTTITCDDIDSLVGKYTCGSSSRTCTNKNFVKIGPRDGTSCWSYGFPAYWRDMIGNSYFYYGVPAHAVVGYMYNYNPPVISYSGIKTQQMINFDSQLGANYMSNNYFSDSYLSGTNARANCSASSNPDVEGNATCYTLGGTPELLSTIVDPTNSGTKDYTKLVGKYTMRSSNQSYGTTSNIKQVYYVVGVSGSTLYVEKLEQNHPLTYYQKAINIAQTYENGSLQNSVQIKNFVTPSELAINPNSWQSTWPFVYSSNSEGKYVCLDGTDTCTPVMYGDVSTWTEITYWDPAYNYNFSSAISYNSSTNKYTLDMNDPDAVNLFKFRMVDLEENSDNLNHARYVCLDNTSDHYPLVNETECTNIGYVITVVKGIWYLPLSGGKYIEPDKNSASFATENNAIYAMFYEPTVNNTDSTIKEAIDYWYENNIYGTTAEDLIDTEAIYCADRSSNNFGTYDQTNHYTGASFEFSGLGGKSVQIAPNHSSNVLNISCPNKTDAFSKDETSKGNGDLTYPIALISYPELYNLGYVETYLPQILPAGSYPYYEYWTMSPESLYGSSAQVYYATSYMNKLMNSNVSTEEVGVRPSIALTSAAGYSKGDGSGTNPYVVEVEE